MFLIRAFEQALEDYFSRGLMRGTTHGSIGQELIPALLIEHLDREVDYLFATHRCHGYYLAYTDDAYSLAAEMMGKMDGPVLGAGGSQHLKKNHFYTNGITGGMAPEAVGVAYGLKQQGKQGLSVAILGDGGFNEGYVQEALNLAAIYAAPVLFLLENNQYAMSTRSSTVTAGSIQERVKSYHIAYYKQDTSDFEQLNKTMVAAVQHVRAGDGPAFLEVETFRLCGHSKSDTCAYMEEGELQAHVEQDPLRRLSQLPIDDINDLEKNAQQLVAAAFEKAALCKEATLAEFENYLQGARGI